MQIQIALIDHLWNHKNFGCLEDVSIPRQIKITYHNDNKSENKLNSYVPFQICTLFITIIVFLFSIHCYVINHWLMFHNDK